MKYKLVNWILRLLRKKSIITLQDYVGLGNRIKQMASYHICYGLDNTVILWNTKGWVNENFNNLFQIGLVKKLKIYNISNSFGVVTSYPTRIEFKERGYWRLFISSNEVPESFEIKRQELIFPSIDFRFGDIPEPIKIKYLQFFDNFKPSEIVAERIKETPNCKDCICIHVRNSNDYKDTATVPSISSFFDIMKKYPSDTRFFISAMSAGIAQQFYAEFENQIIELLNKDYSSMIDAVADMYLLGAGKELIVSSGSTFSEVAWWLGGARQKVIHVPNAYKQGSINDNNHKH